MTRRPGQPLSTEALQEKMIEEATPEVAEAKADEPKEKAPLTPIEEWHNVLKAAKIDERQALEILTKILETGYYSREYTLFNGLLRVVLRTRTIASSRRIAFNLDQLARPYNAAEPDPLHQNISMRLQLIDSLVSYKEQSLPHPGLKASPEEIQKAWEARQSFVDYDIPEPVQMAVYQALFHFNTIVNAALSNGAAHSF
jgi:hypothetical protein